MSSEVQDRGVQFGWGSGPVRRLAARPSKVRYGAIVIVDVLSFSTAVDVALGRGATVLPYCWNDASAAGFAAAQGAVLATRDRNSPGGYSLSPASLDTLLYGTRLVLPSPNGSALSVLASASGAAVYAACLRNAATVAAHVGARSGPVLVVAAGERWPDGRFRAAAEDLWGAGAVISALGLPASPRAALAGEAFLAVRPELAVRLRECGSGRELSERGFAPDLEWASAYEVSTVVPLLRGGEYRDVSAERSGPGCRAGEVFP